MSVATSRCSCAPPAGSFRRTHRCCRKGGGRRRVCDRDVAVTDVDTSLATCPCLCDPLPPLASRSCTVQGLEGAAIRVQASAAAAPGVPTTRSRCWALLATRAHPHYWSQCRCGAQPHGVDLEGPPSGFRGGKRRGDRLAGGGASCAVVPLSPPPTPTVPAVSRATLLAMHSGRGRIHVVHDDKPCKTTRRLKR